MKFVPALSRLLLRKLENTSEQTKGGLFIPETKEQQTVRAEVVAVGPGNQYWDTNKGEMVVVPTSFNVEDRVLIPKFNTTEVTLEGETFILVNASEVLGKLS